MTIEQAVQNTYALPLTAAQRGIYYAQQIDPDVPMSVSAFVEFHGDVDADLLDHAVRDTGIETEAALLRLVHQSDDDVEPKVIVDLERHIHLGRRDFSGSDDPRAAALAWMNDHRSQTVDLFTDPMLATYLLNLGDGHSIWYCWGHHFAFDGYAAMYMMVRVAQRYTAFAADESVPDADIAGMAQIATIDSEYRSSTRFTDDRDHWRRQFADDPQVTSFSTHSDAAAPVATICSAPLDDAVVDGVRKMAESLGVRPASVITAAVALYLARYNNTDEAMLSLPVAVRDTQILRTSAGLTSNVIPIRSRIDHDGPLQVGDLVREVNAEIKGALRHQRFRHEDITHDVLGAANGRRGFFGPMVNVMLFFEHIDFGTLHGALNILSTGPVEDTSVNVYDCMVGGMRLDLEANPNVYDRAAVATHHRRLIDFLTRFVESATTLRATDLRMLADDEAARATENSAGETIELGATTLRGLLHGAAVRFTDRPAVIDPHGQTLSYEQFDARTAAVAGALSERGIGAESVVGVMLPRSTEQVVALHAIIKAGAVFVPLDPAEPDERLNHILATARPALIITADGTDHHIDFPTTTIGELQTGKATESTSPLPDNGAYLLFTSGSTGAPKGVLISHRAIVNRLLWMQHTYPLTPSDRVLQKTPSTFDVSVWEYFWPLITGAALVVARPDGHRDPWYLRTLISEQRVTTTHFVPSMLSAFSDVLSTDPDTPTALKTLRRIFTSGEALTPQTVGATAEITQSPVHNLYGPTEAAIDVTFHNDCAATDSIIPIGRPVWNTRAQLLDRRLSPVPDGAIGDLYLGGIQLARGYQSRPGLTSDRFVADPFGSGERLYRTGDLVRRRRDGTLEYLGRSDSQVKIRGQRVELGEIEAAMSTLTGVRTAAVVVRDDLLAHSVAVGYVAGNELHGRDLRNELAALLPEHMIPTVVMICESLPTTSSGKLDRRALPTPVLTTAEYRSPATPLERLVHDTVCTVLGLPEASMTANLFELGGNSLSATRIAARLSAATGTRLGLRAIFDAGDIGGIAEAVHELGVSGDFDHVAAASAHVLIDGPVPLSPAQHRLWLAAQLDPTASAIYNMPFTVRLIGALDVDALRSALADVVARHEPLRTTVMDESGRPFQHVIEVDDVHFDVPLISSAHADPEGVRDYAALAFDLAAELPIRARLIRHGEQDHTLAVVIHHLAADGWSLAPFARDFADAYRARLADQSPKPAELPVTYRQISADRAAWLDDPQSTAAQQIDFWSQTLADAPVDSDLPYDRLPSGHTDRGGAIVRAAIDGATRRRLADLAADQGVTMFMVLHAAVAALLRGMSGTDDIVVGTPVSGRGDGDLDDLVGMFVNTLVLRTPVDKHASFSDLLSVVRARDLEAFDHADVPFDRLVTELNPPRSSSGQPYFDVSVAIENTPPVELDFAGLTATAARIDTQTGKFDLEFTFTDRGEAELSIEIGYATALFNRSTMTGMASRLTRLLRRVATDPHTSVGDTCVLDPSERFDLVPATGTGPRPAEHLSRLLTGAVAAEPEHTAVIDTADGRSLTYRELDAASNRLARLLIDAGAGPEDFVALSLPRGIEWVVAMWAVVRSGAAWVPIDPGYPAARTAFMLEDSGARLLVTAHGNQTPESAAVDGVTVIDLDDSATRRDWESRPANPISDDDRHTPVEVDQPAYLIYTSGTTGVPKGVIVSHRGLADFAAEQVSRLGLTPRSRTLHLASPSFDASVLEALMAVSAAASMHIVPPGIVGGRELSEVMATARVTHAFLTPSLLHTMSPDDLPDLDTLVIGGEHPNPESVRLWSGDKHLFNAYGPTEATVVATMSQDISPADSVTIGRPIRGVAALVLDERLRPVAPGTTGELYLCGTHLARGYHGVRPLTSKRFVANPYAEPGERMYRTGDLVRWRSDHTLEFRGRADHQTKVRGYRIELGEIDAALVTAENVHEAVTVVAGEGDSARLVSYVAGTDLGVDDTAALRDHLANRLPKHMVPATVVALDKIPTTPIGKVDLRALPTPQAPTGEHEPPRTESELAVAEIVAGLLGLDVATVGREHDFFELGGNSLLATQLAAELERRAASRISVRTLFDDPRICAIAKLADVTSDGPALVPLTHDPVAEVSPGPAQQQLWFLNQLDGSSSDDVATGAYNIAFALDLRGELDVDALAGALTHVVKRHEPLRTTYPALDGQPTLRIAPAEAVQISLQPETVDESDWEARSRALAATPFDLTVDTPLRARLHRIDCGTADSDIVHRLTVVIHHIAADGASLVPLAHDIAVAYADLHAQRTPAQAAPSISYRDYLRWQAASLGYHEERDEQGSHDDRSYAPRRIDELADWWRDELAGVDSSPILAADANPRQLPDVAADSVEVDFDDSIRAALRTQIGSDTTEFMTVHAILAAVLHRVHADAEVHIGSGRSDLVIGTPVAGRADPRLAGLVGMFVNSVPLRAQVHTDMTFGDLLAEIRRADLDALSHSDMPFEQLVAAVKPPRTGRHPLFQIALTFDDTPFASAQANMPAFDGVQVSAMEVETGAARFDLEIRIRDGIARFTYNTTVFSRARIADLASRFTAFAKLVANDPTRKIGDYSLALPTDPTVASAGTPAAVQPRHLADLIEHAVNTRPEAHAIDDGTTVLTYRAADDMANRWANTLVSFGISADDVVAVALDRSIESVISVWAVAKAGAVVLPIDPRYPAQRVEHMISDSGAVLGITSDALFDTVPRAIWWVRTEDLSAGQTGSTRTHRHIGGRAYIIYTSGTTGTPKGVSVTHRGLAAFAASQTVRHGIAAESRALHFASPSFDAAMLELLLAVDSGATTVIAPSNIYGGDELIDFLAAQDVTHAFVTPAALAPAAARDLPSLECLAVGGESFGSDLVERWSIEGRRFLNCYGPTESTIVATMSELLPGHPITIGTTVADSHALVLDNRLRVLPPHTPGDLYLIGPGLADGYHGRRGLTASRFVAAPAASSATIGTRMYRTGDIASMDTEGVLTYHGRSDRQVKVRGFRIELDEVDSALASYPGVRTAVTVTDGTGDSATLASYVTVRDGEPLSQRALIDYAARRLPRQMVPSTVTVLETIPTTVNGKIDRAALPAPDPLVTESVESREPRTAAERLLVDILSDTLGRPVGADDDFFDAGGTSLQATTVVSRINTVHRGEPIRVRDVFDNPVVERLAQLLDIEGAIALEAESDDAGTPADRTRPGRIPLAPMQKRLWSLYRSAPDSVDYAIPLRLNLTGELDADALRGALVDIVTRHSVLRTVYPETHDGPVGIVGDDADTVIGSLRPTADDPETVIKALTQQPFDLSADAPIRAALTSIGTAHSLILVIHHIAADGASLPILVADLIAAYTQRVDGRSATWQPARLDFADYALASARHVASERDDLSYWAERLTGAPAQTSPSADPGVGDRSGGGSVTIPVDTDLRDAIVEAARRNSTSVFTILHCATTILLNRLGVGTDIVVGTPVANRSAPAGSHGDFGGVVGMFVNTVALRTAVDPADTAQHLLDAVRDTDLDAWDHLDAPFDDVIAAVNPPRLPGRHPLFQVALSVHDYADSIAGERLPIATGLVGEVSEIDSPTAKFDLQFTATGMSAEAGRPTLSLTYARNRYRRDTAEQFGLRLLRVVRALTADPQRTVGDIRVTDPLEVAALCPVSGPPAATPRTFAELLEDAVRRNPAGIAAIGEDSTGATTEVTYRQLDARSSGLARLLITRGLADRPETVVAMAIPRSIDALVAIWAIVRAGCAYVPVDPTYPTERIAHMIDDSGAGTIVTTRAHANALPTDTPRLVIDDPAVAQEISAESTTPITDTDRGRPILADQLAYVIYTSGSTGTPKGVLVPHRGLAAVHDALGETMRPAADSRVLQFASPSFDASVLEFLLATAGAATLVIAPTTTFGGADLADFLRRHRVSHAFITPAAVASMTPSDVPELTSLAVGGEAVAPELVRRWAVGRDIRNVYGPTETTIITTESEPLAPDADVTIGGPHNGVGAVVLDGRLHPVPAGVVGDLYLLGDQVTRGYHGRAQLTATRYVSAPMVLGEQYAGQRMYCTGDRVRWSAEGTLDYAGRADNQVQVRGFRVELSEIDNTLSSQPRVRSAVTVADTTSGSTVLHSYVTADGAEIDTAALRRAVAHVLPRHMVPASITELTALPINAVGKLDRSALPAPRVTIGRRAESAAEARVAGIFADVLGVESVGADDNFFDIGGDSLLATTVVTRLREQGDTVAVPDVFAAPTPAELAAALDGEGAATSAALAPLLTLRNGTEPVSQDNPPLIVVHPAIGLSWSFTSLLPHVDPARTVYGLQNPALTGATPASDIGELAADYVARIREVVPQGPYHLLGWSLGGLIAQEMAVRLQRGGDTVGKLILLDSYVLADHPDRQQPESIRELLGELGFDTSEMTGEPNLTSALNAVRAGGGPLADLSADDLAAIHSVFSAAGPLAATWQPRTFVGDAVFVSATGTTVNAGGARMDWVDRITGRIADVAASCSHARMLLPENVTQFAWVIGTTPPPSVDRPKRIANHRKEH
ncbi:amino acid adenylation domain-containing protein [Gordonia sp. CPCC 205333]|uniref:non-ribosomal peptide synthetase n=1 Tax=Gordonia sp. CPCC 205333 TaxID=3140790 RepID=UPI003AF366C3